MAYQTALQIIEDRKDSVLTSLPSHMSRERFYAIAASVLTSPDIKKCSIVSAAQAVFSCAKLGLIPDKNTGHAHIVPFKGVATVIIGYQGLIDLGRRFGLIGDVHAEVVFRGEEFEYWVDETGPRIRHKPNFDGSRDMKDATHVYCLTEIRGSARRQVKVLTRKQVEAVARGNVWRDHPYEMWLKTAIRRAAKTWPMTPELGRAIALDEQAENQQPQELDPIPNGAGEQPIATEATVEPQGMEDDTPDDPDFDLDEAMNRAAPNRSAKG